MAVVKSKDWVGVYKQQVFGCLEAQLNNKYFATTGDYMRSIHYLMSWIMY